MVKSAGGIQEEEWSNQQAEFKEEEWSNQQAEFSPGPKGRAGSRWRPARRGPSHGPKAVTREDVFINCWVC